MVWFLQLGSDLLAEFLHNLVNFYVRALLDGVAIASNKEGKEGNLGSRGKGGDFLVPFFGGDAFIAIASGLLSKSFIANGSAEPGLGWSSGQFVSLVPFVANLSVAGCGMVVVVN